MRKTSDSIVNTKVVTGLKTKAIAQMKNDPLFRPIITELSLTEAEFQNDFSRIYDVYLTQTNPDAVLSPMTMSRDADGNLAFRTCTQSSRQTPINNYLFFDLPEDLRHLDVHDMADTKKTPRVELGILFRQIRNEQTHPWLYLYGGSHTGKTYYLVGLLNNYLKVFPQARIAYLNYPSFVKAMTNDSLHDQDNFFQVMESLRQVDILVFDNFAQGSTSEYARDTILEALLEYRNHADKITIFVSRFSLADVIALFAGTSKTSQIKNENFRQLLNQRLPAKHIFSFGSIARY